jgi:hypothetical protein
MSQYALKKTAFTAEAMEDEIRRRLRRGRTRLLVSHALCFLLTAAVILFLL